MLLHQGLAYNLLISAWPVNHDYKPGQNLATPFNWQSNRKFCFSIVTELWILAETSFKLFLQSNEQSAVRGLTGVSCVCVWGGGCIVKGTGHTNGPSSWYPPKLSSFHRMRIFPHLGLKGGCLSRVFLKIIANLSCDWPLETILSSWSVNSQMVRLKRKREIMEAFWVSAATLILCCSWLWQALDLHFHAGAFHFPASIFPFSTICKLLKLSCWVLGDESFTWCCHFVLIALL